MLNKNFILYILIILAIVSWGGTWVSAKLVANEVNPNILIFWRFLFTFISFIPVIIFAKIKLEFNLKIFLLALAGSVLMTLYNQLFFRGLQTGLAGAGSVIVTTLNPIFCYLFSVFFFKSKTGLKEIIGLIIGFAGGLIIIKIWDVNIKELIMSGNLFFLIAALFWALMTIISQYSCKFMHSFLFSFYLYGISTVLNFFFCINLGVFNVGSYSLNFWINILYLSLIATTFGVTVYFYCSTKLGAYKTGSFMFCVPLSALFLSWIILKEVPAVSTIAGGIITILAVYLINYKLKK